MIGHRRRATPMISVHLRAFITRGPHPRQRGFHGWRLRRDSKEEVDGVLTAKGELRLGRGGRRRAGQRIPDRFFGAYVRDFDGKQNVLFQISV